MPKKEAKETQENLEQKQEKASKEETKTKEAEEKDDNAPLFTININRKNVWQITTAILLVLTVWSFFFRGPMGPETITGNVVAEQQLAQQPAERITVSAEDDAVKGDKKASVTIVEFSDYECPFCGRFYTDALPQIEKEYIKTGKVKIVFRDFPLEFHQYAGKAALAAECAGEQGKYWEMHNKLFENQKDLGDENFKKWAKEIGVKDTEKFNKCYDSNEMAKEIEKDKQDAAKYGVTGTPAFFINGISLVGAQPFSEFKKIIDAELAK